MCPASAEDKYYAVRLIKYSFKKRKKIKNTRGVHIFFFIKHVGSHLTCFT